MAVLKSEEKNKALLAMADALIADTSSILCENKKGYRTQQKTLYLLSCSTGLKLDESRIRAMADGIRAVAALPDPVGRILSDGNRAQTDFIFKKSLYQWVLSLLFTKAAQMSPLMLLL